MERDIYILKQVNEYSFLRVTHIYELLSARTPSIQRSIRNRLKQLYDNLYLVRPHGQFWESRIRGMGAMPTIYVVGKAGSKFLEQRNELKFKHNHEESTFYSWETLRKNILYTDFLFILKKLQNEVTISDRKLYYSRRVPPLTFTWKRKRHLVFFDYGTIPISRNNLKLESFRRKVLRYKDELGQEFQDILFVIDAPDDLQRQLKMMGLVNKICEANTAQKFLFIDASQLSPNKTVRDLLFTDAIGQSRTL